MNIETDKQVVSGKHGDYDFTLDDGVLKFRGTNWSKKNIKTLIDLSILLTIQGYKIKYEIPKKSGKENYSFKMFNLYDDMDE